MTDDSIPTDHIDSFIADLASKGSVVSAPEVPAMSNGEKFGMAGPEPPTQFLSNPEGTPELQSEESLDAILEGLDPGDSAEPDTSWEKPAETERVFKKPGEEDEPAADADEPEAEATAEPAGEVDKDELQAALAALHRDGLPTSVLDEMDPETLLEIGAKAKERQAHSDELARHNAELTKQPSEDAQESGATTTDDPSDGFDLLVQPLVEEIGEDAAGAVVPLVREVVKLATQKASAELEKLQQLVPSMQNQLLQVLTERARDQLSGDYPKLADPDMWATVRERMGVLASSGDYEDPAILLSHACRIEMPGSKSKKRGRRSSQPTAPRGKSRSKPARETADSRILRNLDAGMTAKEARAAANRE